ncbi:MAG: hypothetical protein J5U17_06555 [Candidatus Methanoperedens sp.]|nr:hypothetical protein [Candidatus Methanoperedens sp.]MCE8427843.1 hypothetical protein [Candidatus Methanoperedens sp.]
MNKVRVAIPAWVIERKIMVVYLDINEEFSKEFSDVMQMAPEKKFYEFVAKHVNAYLQEGMMPPTEIAPAIINLVDDYKAGRSMTLRAGDYISLQNYLRKGK